MRSLKMCYGLPLKVSLMVRTLNMMINIGRALCFELLHVRIHFLDSDQQSLWDIKMIV